ncbi:MAG: hypothetical protein SO005_09320 [Candidatus Choladocola sp.]|nr:hypothetical protein [Candidatus Choladocola sp.]
MTCCFFGHKDAPPSIYDTLEEAIEKIIAEDNVTEFLVGNQGQFDGMVLKALRRIKEKYPHVSYNIVLAYMPAEKEECNPYEFGETMLPEGIENVHPRYAISKRNDWMVNESDIVLCYIKHSWGGAAKYVEKAKHKGRIIINLGI